MTAMQEIFEQLHTTINDEDFCRWLADNEDYLLKREKDDHRDSYEDGKDARAKEYQSKADNAKLAELKRINDILAANLRLSSQHDQQ